jgi:hypothetical protein
MEPIRIEITVRLEPCEKLISVLREAFLKPEIEKPLTPVKEIESVKETEVKPENNPHGLTGIKPKVAKEKICTVCGKKYQPTSNVQRFCPACKAAKKLYGGASFKKHTENRSKIKEPIEQTLAEIEQARVKRERETYHFGK